MLEFFKTHINSKLSFLQNSRLLVAISGGIDSVVLTYLCKNLNLDIALVHCNFNLRGRESEDDETFVMALAKQLNLEVFIECFDTYTFAKEHKLSIQMAARELRYKWFDELADQLGYDYILTAHHADDDLETFLINLSRGTGLDGLTGIPAINGKVVRPLLPYTREQIEKFAKTKKLKFREDSSNLSSKYLRNKLRLEVIPQLKQSNPKFLQNFAKTQSYLRDSKDIIDDKIDDISNEIMNDISNEGITFNIEKIRNLSNPKAYLFEMLKEYGFTEWNDVVDLLDAQSGKKLFSESHRLIKDRKVLILTDLQSKSRDTIPIQESQNNIQTNLGVIHLDVVKKVSRSDNKTIFVDKDLLNFPLIVRNWEKGDYFYPFGMKGKKKLSKFFKDEKLSLVAKENSLVLCSNSNVVWILTQRQDNRFKVTSKTKNILKISIQE